MSSSTHIHKSHNVSLLLYHLVCSTKYRRFVLSPKVDRILKRTCLDIEDRYEIHFLEIGFDKDHIHFLLKSVPSYSPTKIARTIKVLQLVRYLHKHLVLKELFGVGPFGEVDIILIQLVGIAMNK